jgi:hypothetical protein
MILIQSTAQKPTELKDTATSIYKLETYKLGCSKDKLLSRFPLENLV